VAGMETRIMKGPTLAHVASRTIDLARWVRTPQAVKPGVLMPDAHLSEADAIAITEYLSSLK